MIKNRPLLFEVIDFVIKEKRWWLLPTIFGLLIAGLVIVFGQSSSVVSTFIYPLF